MSDKTMAVLAIMWLISTVHFTIVAIKGNYPAYFGIATSTISTGLAVALAYLFLIVLK